MPVYVYRRQDGSEFEIEQRMVEDALVNCPATGQFVERVLQPFTPRYTGTGFYSTDHRKAAAEGTPSDGTRSPPDRPSRSAGAPTPAPADGVNRGASGR